jgi:hypothetical protein
MRKIIFALTVLLLTSAISFQSCSSCNKKHKRDDKDSVFAKGKVIPNVLCRKDINQSYALYLPSKYSEDKKWPVVYAFDSHGCGLLPVDLFKDDAEKYGYIIVGSNNSKNGTQWNVTSEIYDTLYNDTHRRFSIDDSRIYTAGFSGGSRVASTIAITKGGINSVIGCGAGLGSQEQPQQKFGYFGIAGNADMNLTEMVILDSALEKSGYRHYLESFEGKHEWPPKTVVSDAFLWLELNAIKDNLKTKNDTLVKNKLNKWKKNYLSLNSEKKYYDAYLLCKKIISYFEGLMDVSSFKTEKSNLEKNPAVNQMKKHLNEIAKQETKLQSYYAEAISSQTIDWWKSQVGQINQKIKTISDNEEKFMYKRLLNYLSLASFMNVNGSMQSGKLDNAEKFNTIYTIIDPENPDHAYFSATLSMKKGKQDEALQFLEQAAKLGFSDQSKLEKDEILAPLKQLEKYPAILDSIKKNANKKQ